MVRTTIKVSGMACSMCEAHINDAIRAAFPVEKVSSSHSRGKTVILSQEPPDENAGTWRRPLGFLHEDR